MPRRLARLLVIPAVSVLALSACSGDDKGDQDAGLPSAPPKVSSAPTAAESPEPEESAASDSEPTTAEAQEPASSEPAETGASESAQPSPASAAESAAESGTAEDASPVTEASPTAEPSSATDASSAAAAPSSDAKSTEGRGRDCGNLSAEEAAKHGVTQLDRNVTLGGTIRDFNWDARTADLSHYDPCATLSVIQVWPLNGTASTPSHLMMFNKGEYKGVGTKDPRGSAREITRVNDSTLDVEYSFHGPRDPGYNPTGRANATYTWSSAAERVVLTGEVPPLDDSAHPDVIGPDGNATPGGEAQEDAGAGDVPQAEVVVDGVARIISGSGKIGCEITTDAADCGVEEYLQNNRYGTTSDGYFTNWWIVMPADAAPFITGKSDAPNYRGANDGIPGQELEWGESVRHGQVTCTSERTGLTCENAASGYGVTMNKREYTVSRLK